jgi:hypothetical protein
MSLRRFRTPDGPACIVVVIPTALSWLNIFALDCILIYFFLRPVYRDSAGAICVFIVCVALVMDTVLILLVAVCDCLMYFYFKWTATEFCEIWSSDSDVDGGFRSRGV